jgi:hypothetical protein
MLAVPRAIAQLGPSGAISATIGATSRVIATTSIATCPKAAMAPRARRKLTFAMIWRMACGLFSGPDRMKFEVLHMPAAERRYKEMRRQLVVEGGRVSIASPNDEK